MNVVVSRAAIADIGSNGADTTNINRAKNLSPPHPEELREAQRLEGWGGPMVRDGPAALLTMRPITHRLLFLRHARHSGPAFGRPEHKPCARHP